MSYLEAQGTQVLILGPTIDNPPLEGAGTFIAVPSLPLPGRSDYRLSLLPDRAVRTRLHAVDQRV